MTRAPRSEVVLRIGLGAIGLAALGYGGYRLLGNQVASQPPKLATWLIAAIILHDFVLTPVVVGIGLLVTQFVAPRARRYLQGALVTGGLVTAFSALLIYRRGTATSSKALLRQDYAAHLLLILALITAVTAAAYVMRVMRDRRSQRASEANVRPPAVQATGTPKPSAPA
ncbi:MAG: hypothetical protein M3Y44_06020 [Actinomycetota bacterium]|nr:hypothetical protein [Actinomycetota bacterium]